MVDYNKQKKEAFNIIKQFVKANKFLTEDIIFHVEDQTGFSKKWINNYIQERLDRNIWKKNKTGILSETTQ